MGWYAIYVKTGQEESICTRVNKKLNQIGYDKQYKLLVPKRQLIEKHQGAFIEKYKVMFPGYILVYTEYIIELYYKTIGCKDIYRYLKNGCDLQQIALNEISNILCMIDENGIIGISDIYIESDIVKVTSGPLCHYFGWIKKIDRHKHRAKVLFRLQGKNYLIDLSVHFIDKPTDSEVKAVFPFYIR